MNQFLIWYVYYFSKIYAVDYKVLISIKIMYQTLKGKEHDPPEAYSEACQTSKIDCFEKIVNSF